MYKGLTRLVVMVLLVCICPVCLFFLLSLVQDWLVCLGLVGDILCVEIVECGRFRGWQCLGLGWVAILLLILFLFFLFFCTCVGLLVIGEDSGGDI